MFITSMLLAGAITAADWAKINKPVATEPTPIGAYANGCISGAVSADLNNPNYQVIRQQNKRFYGHPELVDYLNKLGEKAHNNGLPILLIGDMSMPRGGPFIKGHASHQTGLDVDIWFRMVKKPLSNKELKTPWALNIVADNWLETNKYYSKNIYTLVKLAAEDPRVERIFINPAIKEKLCQDTPQDERSWLSKVRPWWGHNAHIHVRLGCPAGSSFCEKQAPVANSDGCGKEVQTWLDDIRHPKPKPKPEPKPPKIIPEKCYDVLQAK